MSNLKPGQMRCNEKYDCIEDLYDKLEKASPVETCEEAWRLISDTLNALEDIYTNVKYDPKTVATSDVRMHLLGLSVFNTDIEGCLWKELNRATRVYLYKNGAIQISDKYGGGVELRGKDGKGPPSRK